MRVLMVCLGNICRSPLAEGILQHKVNSGDLDWEVDSAGTGAWHAGELPDPRSQAVAKKNGIDITNQRARQFTTNDFESFDLIYVMDAENYYNVIKLAQSEDHKQKVMMIMNMAFPNENRRVPDPYYGGPNGFDDVFDMLDVACNAIIAKQTKT